MKSELSIPLATTLLYVTAFILANLDGYHLHFIDTWNSKPVSLKTEIPNAYWIHGWPVGFAVRPSVYSKSAGKGVVIRSFAISDQGVYSRWPIDSFVQRFDLLAFLTDVLYFVATSFGICIATRQFCNRFRLKLRFGISSLILLTAACALVARFREPIFTNRFYLQYFILAVLYAGAFAIFFWMTLSVCNFLLAVCWNRTAQRAADEAIDQPF